MNPNLKTFLAILGGAIVGGLVNAGLIALGGSVFPAPEGVDPNDIESIIAHADEYKLQHFIGPFLAHALGTLVGAFLAAKIAPAGKKKMSAYVIGGLFLLGGLMMAFAIPAFMSFSAVDILLAYIPMAYLGYRFATNNGELDAVE